MKCLQMKSMTFSDVFITEPEDLLAKLANLLKIKGDWELTQNALKQILVLLEKYEKLNNALPMSAVRQSGLVNTIS